MQAMGRVTARAGAIGAQAGLAPEVEGVMDVADSTGSEAVVSRREAIIGALALAAGSLIATRPEPALANDGQAMYIGAGMVSTAITSITRRVTPAGDDLSYAFLNHNLGDQQLGVYGGVTATGGAESTGVYGLASLKGQYGVQAENADGGTALRVLGKAEFQMSGLSKVTKKHSTKTVPVPLGLSSTAMILVTLQGSGGSGVYLKYAKRVDATSFKVVLNKKATSTVTFAWMVLG